MKRRARPLVCALVLVALVLLVVAANAFESSTLASFVDTKVINETDRAVQVTGSVMRNLNHWKRL